MLLLHPLSWKKILSRTSSFGEAMKKELSYISSICVNYPGELLMCTFNALAILFIYIYICTALIIIIKTGHNTNIQQENEEINFGSVLTKHQ